MTMSASDQNNERSREELEFAQNVVTKELSYRRDKRWQIFAWASTMLIAVTGGAAVSTQHGPAFSFMQRCALTLAVAILSLQSILWCHEQGESEDELKTELESLHQRLGVPSLTRGRRYPLVGFTITLSGLAGAP